MEEAKYKLIQFSNMQVAFKEERTNRFYDIYNDVYKSHTTGGILDVVNEEVVAEGDESPGDWKTALAHGIEGIKAGQHANLIKIWQNLYGVWATIELEGRKIDVRPENLNVTLKGINS
jgi:hypothetical protein